MEEKKRKKKAKSTERTERKANACHTSTERLKNWQEVYATVDDIQQFLSERVMLRFNVVTRRVEVHWLTDFGDAPPQLDDWTMLTDRVVNSLWVEMSQQKPVRVQDIFRVIESDYVAEYNPFAFYLERLPPWNGDLDHILGLSMSVMVKGGTDEQFLFAEYLKKWLVGMVAAWVNPQVVNNVILVLIGPQGAYKTTWFNYLLPPELRRYFYTKTNASRMSKDDLLVLAQYGLVCCEELDTMRPAELNQLKAAVTMLSVDERAAYFLSDPTGNRRWLPFEVESIEPPHDNPLDYRNIYSQAYSLYRKGFRYWFTQQEIERLARHNQQFETANLELELVSQYFRKPLDNEPGEFISVAMALQIVGANITQKLSKEMVSRAFTKLGFQSRRTSKYRGYIVVRRSAEEMRSMRFQMAAGVDYDANDGNDGNDTVF